MRIAELTIYVVHLPLRRAVKHATAARRDSANLVARCRLADGTTGWGEGVPRSYVTGETPEGALAQLANTALGEQLGSDCGTWHDVFQLCDRLKPAEESQDARGCHGNALRCTLELSILDAYARLLGDPLRAVTHRFEPAAAIGTIRNQVRYSSAITAEGAWSEAVSALKTRAYGFAHCKVKVAVAGADDRRRLQRIRRFLGGEIDMRLDANGAWGAKEAVARIEPLLAYHVSCVEQPVAHAEIEGLAEIRRQLPVPVMLDESLCSLSDAQEAIRHGTCDLFNIRLSKCGGFLNSLRLAAVAHEAGLGYQLGCHPGESGILSAAGRHWACSVDNTRYLEGSYDRHLLQETLIKEDITFGYGGRAPALDGPGLGITVDDAALKRLAVHQATYRLE